MARKKKSEASQGEDAARPTEPQSGADASPRSSAKKLLLRIRDRYKVMSEADQENRRCALDDIKFVNELGYQWDSNMKKKRGSRPCYEFNKLRPNGKRVINEIRANRPQGKVRATEGGDTEIAEIYGGLCRNIWASSDGDTIIDNAAEYQVDGGMTAWRVSTKYSDDTAFDQDIVIEGFKNPFCVYADPACKDVLKRDAEDWIVTERISNSSFSTRWPKAERVSFDDVEFDDEEEWENDETTRICEYWYKEPYDKEIWLVSFPQEDGTTKKITVDSTSDEAQGIDPAMILKRRTVRCHKVMMCIAGGGDRLLEGPVEWAGAEFPFVMVYGEHKVIDGKFKWWGLHRFARDAQQSYNVSRTAIDETIAQAPKAKWWATPEQAKGHTDKWSVAHDENLPFMLYNADPKAPGPPPYMPGGVVPVALLQQAEIAAQDIRDVTGLHEASFGEESDEKSGVALARKQSQAQIVTYNFPDNMAKGIRRTWEILIDLIPSIYDAERELRILGSDGAEDYVKVNELVQTVGPDGMPTTARVNDLSVGKYDVAITVGPSFSTQRQEAAEIYGELFGRNPALQQIAGDLLFKSMDLPYADDIAERFKTILPPQIQQMLSEGKELTPEVMQAQAQVQQAMQVVQQQTQLVQQAAQEVQQDQAQSVKAMAEVDKALANLKTAEAQFEAKVAKLEADLVKRETLLQAKEMVVNGQQQATEGAAKQITSVESVAQQLDQYLAQFMQSVAEAMAQIRSESGNAMQQMHAALAEMKSRPKIKSVRMERTAGQPPRAVPEYDDAPVA